MTDFTMILPDNSNNYDRNLKPLEIALLSPYHGGSHKAWAEGFKASSCHHVELLTMPDRFWKWRMHGGAVTLARAFLERNLSPDLIIATDMLDLTTFLSLTQTPRKKINSILYAHENQLTYPLPDDTTIGAMRNQKGERDLHYAFINYASMLAADRVFFNSAYHQNSFFSELKRFLNSFPEYNEMKTIDELKNKSSILPVGINIRRLMPKPPEISRWDMPTILWNQRWEYDKNPTLFFKTLFSLADEEVPFKLAVCGKKFRRQPNEFIQAHELLSNQIIHFGTAGEEEYRQLLWQSDITISTAHHEFFGISIVEAIACNTLPILPNRLSYPEIIPSQYHPICLYDNPTELKDRVRWAIKNPIKITQVAQELAVHVRQFDWSILGPRYDAEFAKVQSGK